MKILSVNNYQTNKQQNNSQKTNFGMVTMNCYDGLKSLLPSALSKIAIEGKEGEDLFLVFKIQENTQEGREIYTKLQTFVQTLSEKFKKKNIIIDVKPTPDEVCQNMIDEYKDAYNGIYKK